MTYTTCCGNQDRKITTSETHPKRPPNKTRNCYLPNQFDATKCGSDNDNACEGVGYCDACKPDDYGGYCKDGSKFYISRGPKFVELDTQDLLDRHGSSTSSDSDRRRDLADYDRRMTNRIRQLQIRGKDPLQAKKLTTMVAHDFASSFLWYMGVGISVIIVFISIIIFMIQNKFFLN